MSDQELRSLAEKYVEKQLKLANATVSDAKRGEMVEAAIDIINPKHESATLT
jgi:hypothetical protein